MNIQQPVTHRRSPVIGSVLFKRQACPTYNSAEAGFSVNRTYEAKYHLQEERNWWFEARRDLVIKLLQHTDHNSKILEIGCSGGPFIRTLNAHGYRDVYGIDISKDAVDLCRTRGMRNIAVMDATRLGFKDGEFDAVIASDVLEHIQDEDLALSECNRILKPAGKLIVFVPAFEFLWSKHDEANHHYRRYSKFRLVRGLADANFEVSRSSYWNLFLFFPACLVRLLQRIQWRQNRKGDQLFELNSLLNELLIRLLKAENAILSLINFPVGVSVFAIAGKRADSR
jgi:SAM-dependent methyltransferase